MQIAEILELYQFNRWAHERSLDAAAELSTEQYNRDLGGSFPSLRATLEHLLTTEITWLSRWQGHSLAEGPDYTECADVSALRMRWRAYWNRQNRYFSALTQEDLSQLVGIRTRTGIETVQPLSDTLLHVVNHATYHRGQIASQLRQLGGNPPNTDYFTYCLVRDAGPEQASGG
jgi:uncharacterized damage-inducible protein DinB